MIVLQEEEPALYARMQEANLIRQYDLLTNCIEIGLKKGPTAFNTHTLWALNHVAVANIAQLGGRFRQEPVYVGYHIPPHFKDVPELMDRFIVFIHENWHKCSPSQLAAYGLWRLNWLHPFVEGNGRTARAACYYLFCVRHGEVLGGGKILPERIRENREPYYAALRAADRAWDRGHFDVNELDQYLSGLVEAQLRNDP